MRMPVDDLLSNWAYMVMTSLAWNLKAWFGLLLPNDQRGGELIKMASALTYGASLCARADASSPHNELMSYNSWLKRSSRPGSICFGCVQLMKRKIDASARGQQMANYAPIIAKIALGATPKVKIRISIPYAGTSMRFGSKNRSRRCQNAPAACTRVGFFAYYAYPRHPG